jgi:hypothetical protein
MAAEPIATLTVAIASYRRRRPLEQLLRCLAAQLAGSVELRRGLDVVVVLDGSTDGSQAAVEALDLRVPVRVVWQPNQGLAAARNAGLAAAEGELIWFLDDDLVPAAGLVAAHRRMTDPTDRSVLVGPCLPAPWHRVHPLVRQFWAERHAELSEAGLVTRFDRFSAANTSGPVDAFRSVGGFDAAFVGYGAEDYELAVRLLAAGTVPRYVADAVAWHAPPHGAVAMCTRQRDEGVNQIRLVQRHPETFDEVFPLAAPTAALRAIRRLDLHRRPRLLDAVATALLPVVAVEERLSHQRRWRVLGVASTAAYVGSVARHDPDGRFTSRVLGAATT